MNGGAVIAGVLRAQGVRFLFTLIGGYISPILVEAKRAGLRVIDTRHEATAVFAADAVARLTGIPGVAAVTAGPGVTNTLTALKNAQMAQSPLVLLGGAAPTALQGRGALQDIDHLAAVASAVKWSKSVKRLKDLGPALEMAFKKATEGVPGPVFVECPADVLYDEETVRGWYNMGAKTAAIVKPNPRKSSVRSRAVGAYLSWHVDRLFAGKMARWNPARRAMPTWKPDAAKVMAMVEKLKEAERPVCVVGSQAVQSVSRVAETAAALEALGIPVFLTGMARGLLGRNHPLHMRHRRRRALEEADFVLLAGVPADFRLDYGRHIPHRATIVAVNKSSADLNRNRRPTLGLVGAPGALLRAFAGAARGCGPWTGWKAELRQRDVASEADVHKRARTESDPINTLRLGEAIEAAAPEDTIFIGDGVDFVSASSFLVRPRTPLSWLDPGPLGTLGVGAGFALAAKLCRPEAEVWALFDDGALGYSLTEFDTFARHGLSILAVVGNDASWSQIARGQIEMLGDDVGTTLAYADYHTAVEGLGGLGFLVDTPADLADALAQARAALHHGRPVLLNVILGKTDSRKGPPSL